MKEINKNQLVRKNKESSESSIANNEKYSKGRHPNSKKNLKKFPKGISGNPLGRPYKCNDLIKALKRIGEQQQHDIIEGNLGTRKEQVLTKIWSIAQDGDLAFVKLLAGLGCLDD